MYLTQTIFFTTDLLFYSAPKIKQCLLYYNNYAIVMLRLKLRIHSGSTRQNAVL